MRPLYIARDADSGVVKFFSKEPEKRKDLYTGETVYRRDDAYDTFLTSECVKMLSRYVGKTVRPGQCRKVVVKIEPAE
jgi:hypothetical protein